MDAHQLTAQQAERLKQIVARELRFMNRLCARMQQLQFPLDHPLWLAAGTARNALQDLLTAAHYESCKSGAGRE